MANQQEEVFITKIHINDVRHLKDIEIPISETERKHLILTGKNGSGKTSVLEATNAYFKSIEDNNFSNLLFTWKNHIKNAENAVKKYENQEKIARGNQLKNLKNNIRSNYSAIENWKKNIDNYESKVNIGFSTTEVIQEKYNQGNLIISHFDAKRLSKSKTPKGITKFEFKTKYKLAEQANENFIQHIVNLKADKSFARDDNELQTVREIDNWFNRFERALKELFEDNSINLKFDRKNYNFQILSNGKKPFTFNELSDGYSAVLHILTELIMRMENQKAKSYDIQGIVLIDEIETHLHIALQKKILPFLTSFFPKIQFIVTTHSPFVLNSIENAVVYDLENRIRVEDASGYSVDGLIESYFLSDKYSEKLKTKVNRYENLMEKSFLIETEKSELLSLEMYFEDLPKFLAPELQVKLQQIKLAKLNV